MGEIEGETPCLALGDGKQTPSKSLTPVSPVSVSVSQLYNFSPSQESLLQFRIFLKRLSTFEYSYPG